MTKLWVLTAAPHGNAIYTNWGIELGDKEALNEKYEQIAFEVFDSYFKFGKDLPKEESTVRYVDEEFRKTQFKAKVLGVKRNIPPVHSISNVKADKNIYKVSAEIHNRLYSKDDIPFGEALIVVEHSMPQIAAKICGIFKNDYNWPTALFKGNELEDKDEILIKTLKEIQEKTPKMG